MDKMWQEILWSQFHAAIDMFGSALEACPEDLWRGRMWNDPGMPPEFSEFWYIAYHTLFWLDLYLSGDVEGFTPPYPFTLGELEPQAVLPDKCYIKQELQVYLDYCCRKCQEVVDQLTDEKAGRKCSFWWTKGDIRFAELLLDTLRHVQEHGAQLHMYLGQRSSINSKWLEAKDDVTST